MPRKPDSQSNALAHRASGGVASGAQIDPGGTASTLGLEFAADSEHPWTEWEQVPGHVLTALARADCSPEPLFVAGSAEPRVRRRGTQYLERASAWAVGPTMLVVVDAVRPLERAGGNRFRPAGDWHLDVKRQMVIDEPKRRVGTVPADVLPTGTSAPSANGDTPNATFIDLLPAVVRKQILTTVPSPVVEREYLWRYSHKDRPYRHEAGHLRADAGRVIATLAEREIGTSRLQSVRAAEQALDRAAWSVTTLTAQLGQPQAIEIDAAVSRTALPNNRPPSRPQIG